jgi:hypothetical protein
MNYVIKFFYSELGFELIETLAILINSRLVSTEKEGFSTKFDLSLSHKKLILSYQQDRWMFREAVSLQRSKGKQADGVRWSTMKDALDSVSGVKRRHWSATRHPSICKLSQDRRRRPSDRQTLAAGHSVTDPRYDPGSIPLQTCLSEAIPLTEWCPSVYEARWSVCRTSGRTDRQMGQ